MKRLFGYVTVTALLLTVLSGCASPAAENAKDFSADSTTATTTTVSAERIGDTTPTANSAPASVPSAQEGQSVAVDSSRITRDEAKNIALTVAGVTEEDISRLKIELDYDDDTHRWEYEIEFYVGNREYDIDVDAVSGEILHNTTDPEPVQSSATTADGFISRDEAKRLALQRADVTADQISDFELDLDYDDDARRWEYEISFNVGRTEYECEIHAQNGTIIYLEKDIDD